MTLNHTAKIRAIITGATGMVGEGVLLECLENQDVEAVLVINRKPCGLTHPKLRELIVPDFFQLDAIQDQIAGYNACYFCLGVSSLGISKEEYKHITYDLTLNLCILLQKHNPDMTFCYVTGAGTDSSENGRVNWANVKGATENAIMKLFKNAYMFRPALMKATAGQNNIPSYYKYLEWMYNIGRKIYPAGFCTLQEVGLAMIAVSKNGYSRQIINVKDIVILADFK
jgi:nucleoside-diphosphate-sugar epimerase